MKMHDIYRGEFVAQTLGERKASDMEMPMQERRGGRKGMYNRPR